MSIRVLQISRAKELDRLFSGLKVDPYGIRIMAPKARNLLIRLENISCFAANILKQELLSCGGDAALPRGTLTGKTGKTSCILIATLSQIDRLREKLLLQPFGLNRLSQDLKMGITNYLREDLVLDLGRQKFSLGKQPLVMGILNLTPDSFSGDGLYGQNAESIAARGRKLEGDGADILDLGGASSRPGAKPVPLKD